MGPFLQTLYGFLRLRIPSGTSLVLPDLRGCALIRELHVYGKLKKVRDRVGGAHQQVFCLFWRNGSGFNGGPVAHPPTRESLGRFHRLTALAFSCCVGVVCRVVRRE